MSTGEWTVGETGIRETLRAFRQIDRELPKMIRRERNDAAQTVVLLARRKRARLWRSRRSRTTDSIRARSTPTRTRVLGGGRRFPHFKGQEFGSNRFKQFRPWSGPAPGGRGSMGHAMFPAAREGGAEFRDALEAGVERTARAAAFRTRGF